jgi:hypothetical protein
VFEVLVKEFNQLNQVIVVLMVLVMLVELDLLTCLHQVVKVLLEVVVLLL